MGKKIFVPKFSLITDSRRKKFLDSGIQIPLQGAKTAEVNRFWPKKKTKKTGNKRIS